VPSRGSNLSPDDLRRQGADAYADFCLQVYSLVRAIPVGCVCTYGRLAQAIACPARMDPLAYRRIRARWAGYALAKCPADVPWWRVVNAQGQISRRSGHGPHVQAVYLQEEGIAVDGAGRVSLDRVLWNPPNLAPHER